VDNKEDNLLPALISGRKRMELKELRTGSGIEPTFFM
jgi:hypothetical protein